MTTQSPEFHFVPGVAFSMIGATFRARAHRYYSIIGDKGSSAFSDDLPLALAVMNTSVSREVVESLNPTVSFQVGDVARIPIFPVANADTIFSTLEAAFTEHESHREPSVEFRSPGPSPWRAAQDWAQRSVDRPEGAPLPPYEPQHDPPDPEAAVSFAIGVALGRFGAKRRGHPRPGAGGRAARGHLVRGAPRRHRGLAEAPRVRAHSRGVGRGTAGDHRRHEGHPAGLAAQGPVRAPQGPVREPAHLFSAVEQEEELRRLGQHPPLGRQHPLHLAGRSPEPRPCARSTWS